MLVEGLEACAAIVLLFWWLRARQVVYGKHSLYKYSTRRYT